MRRQYINRKGELAYLDDNEIMPDGGTLRVSAFLMDGAADDVQKAIASSNVRITDSAGRPAGSRPGFCYDNNIDETQARIAYDKMIARAQSNWRGPNAALPISDANTPELAFAAHEKYLKDAWRTPQARDEVTLPGGDDNEVELARRKYIDGLSNAWRTCRGVGFGPGSHGA